jgi:hypothetical protein
MPYSTGPAEACEPVHNQAIQIRGEAAESASGQEETFALQARALLINLLLLSRKD